jgi:hypothetical protein
MCGQKQPPKKNKCKIAMQKRNAKQIKIKHKKCSVGAKTQMSKMLLDTRLIHIQGGVEDVQSRLPGFHAFQFLPLPHMQYVTHHVSHTLFHTQLCHTSSFTHHFVTHHFSPHHLTATFVTTLSHTTFSHNFVDQLFLPWSLGPKQSRRAAIMFQHVLACFSIFWHALACFRTFWHVLGCFRMFWACF